MKKYFITLVLILIIVFTSVAQINLNNPNIDAIMFSQGASKIFKNSKVHNVEIQGIPYVQKTFAQAKVENVTQKYYMRYNVFADEFEFITPKNDTLILDKINAFSSITFIANNKNYNLVNYTDSKGKSINGYLIRAYKKNDVSLYEKENIIFYEEKIAKTSMERNMPARFTRSDNTYFIAVKNGTIVEFPDSKKRLLKLMPERKEALETFLKENKVSFDDPSDRIKIIDFIATL